MRVQPHLDHYLAAARECTGDPLPAHWEWVGRRHLSRLCGCTFPPVDPEAEG